MEPDTCAWRGQLKVGHGTTLKGELSPLLTTCSAHKVEISPLSLMRPCNGNLLCKATLWSFYPSSTLRLYPYT